MQLAHLQHFTKSVNGRHEACPFHSGGQSQYAL